MMSNEKTELVESAEAASSPSSDPLAVLETAPLLLVDAKKLVAGFRYLQHRVPEYTQLSVEEARSMTRVAHLDPEFIEMGIQTASAWDQAGILVGRSADQLRDQADAIREWDEVERELTVLLKGIAAANLKRKHRLGTAILKLYRILGSMVRRNDDQLRPYFDDMKRAYLRRRKKTGKAAAEVEPEVPRD